MFTCFQRDSIFIINSPVWYLLQSGSSGVAVMLLYFFVVFFFFPLFCCCSFCCLQLSVYWPNVKVSNVNDRCSDDDDDDKAILTEGLQSHTQQPQHVHWCTQQTDFSYRHCWRVPVLYWHFSTPFNLPACQLVINKHYVSLVAFPLSFSRATAAASAVIYSDSLSLSLRFA